jgi:tRNA(fMet)-specific endonuclease VapC
VNYCLDTNIVIAALNGNERVSERLESIPLHDILLPLMVIVELLYGAHRSVRRDSNLARVQQLLERFRIAAVDAALVRRYAQVRAQVEANGRAKSDFDLLIACSALEYDCILVTNDSALNDGAIAGLVVQDWLE